MRGLKAIALIVLMIPCVSSAAEIGPYPKDYKERINAFVKQNFYDPYSIRDFAISQPFQAYDAYNRQTTWNVCFRANAKNRMGGYTGIQDTEIKFLPGGGMQYANSQPSVPAPSRDCKAPFN
jgi:hypothetical protein